MIGAIIGGATSAIGGAFAGAAANKGYSQAFKMYNNRLSDVKQHRDNLYYQDPTQSAENQAAVTQAKQLLDAKTEQAKANNIVTGGTDESLALSKQAAADTTGNMMQQQAVQGAAKKESIWNNADNQINTMTNYIAQTKIDRGNAKAKAITSAASGLSNAANSLPI
jgi:hypothetical protein